MLIDQTSGQNNADLPLDRTLTPGGVAEDITTQPAPPWEINRTSSYPWPVGQGETQDSVLVPNPFEGLF